MTLSLKSIADLANHRRLLESPYENSIAEDDTGQRTLTNSDEVELADMFAFLTPSTRDSSCIAAACLEEDGDGQGMTVLLASNTEDLTCRRSALRDLCDTLEMVARNGQS